MQHRAFRAFLVAWPHSVCTSGVGLNVAKTVDLVEKLDPLDVVSGRDEFSQPAVIADKGTVFGGRHMVRF